MYTIRDYDSEFYFYEIEYKNWQKKKEAWNLFGCIIWFPLEKQILKLNKKIVLTGTTLQVYLWYVLYQNKLNGQAQIVVILIKDKHNYRELCYWMFI